MPSGTQKCGKTGMSSAIF